MPIERDSSQLLIVDVQERLAPVNETPGKWASAFFRWKIKLNDGLFLVREGQILGVGS